VRYTECDAAIFYFNNKATCILPLEYGNKVKFATYFESQVSESNACFKVSLSNFWPVDTAALALATTSRILQPSNSKTWGVKYKYNQFQEQLTVAQQLRYSQSPM
jgi:hypothetical protein